MNYSKLCIACMMAMLVGQMAFAKGTSYESLSDNELSAGICIIANQGVYTAASERQAGNNKAAAKKQLESDLKQLSKSFSNQKFIHSIGQIWYQSLDKVYQMPIMNSKSDKARFVSVVTEEAFLSCMNNFGK